MYEESVEFTSLEMSYMSLAQGSSLSVSHHIMLMSLKKQVTIESGKLDVNVNDNRPVDVLQVSIAGRICNPRLSPPQEPPTLKFAHVVLNALSACKMNLVCKQKKSPPFEV